MWYVIYCRGRDVHNIIASCKEKISSDVLKDAFLFTYARMLKFKGEWNVVVKEMFPDYIFISTDKEKELYDELRQYEDFLTIMENDKMLIPVSKEDERRLTVLCGKGHHLGVSKGVIRNGVTIVNEGPLKGMEDMIIHIDRHKRLATVKLDLPGGIGNEIKAAIEITEKS